MHEQFLLDNTVILFKTSEILVVICIDYSYQHQREYRASLYSVHRAFDKLFLHKIITTNPKNQIVILSFESDRSNEGCKNTLIFVNVLVDETS